MGKMNNIALDLEELRKGASKLSEILATASEILITFNQIITSIESTFSSTPEKTKAEVKCVTLEQVRAVLAEKSRSGKTTDVKELLTRFGVNKLSELDASRYGELLKEAEGI